ncbi:MAG: hypothetical protein KY460_04310 [Actinobacteria bacterium]|nr:hypothetical protein [Actinomycetota bacterium]
MRTLADLQRPDDDSGGQLPLALRNARTVTTPEFAGMTFLEVEARSALNAVRGMPFKWSINPYRGCSHACSHCLDGDTPILTADGRTTPLRAIRVGDEVYGTQRRGRLRRFVQTTVLAHWSVTRPAFRILLEDGRALVAGGEHRFLTHRGWRHVTGPHDQAGRWARLLVSDWLAGPRLPVRAGGALELATRVVAVEPLGVERALFDMTTGTGDFISAGVVSHNCFARPTHAYLKLSPGADFERTVVVKTNVVEVLRAELARPGWRGEPVALGTNTDPYQRCEGRYRLMPGVVEALTQARTPVSRDSTRSPPSTTPVCRPASCWRRSCPASTTTASRSPS